MVIHSFASEQIQNENAEGEGYSKKAINPACSGEAQQRQGSHLLVAATILATFRDIARIRAADMADLFPFPDCPNGPHAHPAEQGAIIQADHSAGQSLHST